MEQRLDVAFAVLLACASLPSVFFPSNLFLSTLWTNLSVLADSSRQLLHFLFSPFPSGLQALPGQSIIILQGSCNAEISGQNSHSEMIQSESYFFFLDGQCVWRRLRKGPRKRV